MLDHDEAELEGLPLSSGGVPDLAATLLSRKAFYSSSVTPLTRHDEAESECLLLCRGVVFDLAMTVLSDDLAMTKLNRKVFYSATAASPTWL